MNALSENKNVVLEMQRIHAGSGLCQLFSHSSATPKVDYFAVFGLQKRYFIDAEDVRSAHFAPGEDFTSGQVASSICGRETHVQQWMALVNEGLRVLENDILRARYLATGSATGVRNWRKNGYSIFRDHF